jgi:hypothetical protein
VLPAGTVAVRTGELGAGTTLTDAVALVAVDGAGVEAVRGAAECGAGVVGALPREPVPFVDVAQPLSTASAAAATTIR